MANEDPTRRAMILGALGLAAAPIAARADDDDRERFRRHEKGWRRRDLSKRQRRKLRKLRRERDDRVERAFEEFDHEYRRALRAYEARGTRRAYRRFESRVWDLEARLERRLRRLDRRFREEAALIRYDG